MVKQEGDGIFVTQKMIGAEEIVKAGRFHRLQHGLAHPHDVDITAALAHHLDDRLQGMNPADVDLVDAVHPQQQKSVVGMFLDIFSYRLGDMVGGAKVEVAEDVEDGQLGARGFLRLVGEVVVIAGGCDGNNLGSAGLVDVDRQGDQNTRQDGELERQKQGR